MKETEFQTKVLIPLFRAMKFRDVTPFGGGSLERGKDIVMWKESDFGQRINFGVVVKAKKITGNAETNAGAMNVLNQVRQMLKTTYLNPVSGDVERIKRCIVACSKEITKEAMNSIEGELENDLNKIVEWVHPETNLFQLVEQYLPQQGIFEKLSSVQNELDESMKDTPYRIIAKSDQSFSILGKHEKAAEEMPFVINSKFRFDTSTPEGKEAFDKWQNHIKKGTPIEIDGRFIESFEFPDFMPSWFKPSPTKEAKLEIRQNVPNLKVPIKVSFETSDGQTASFDYIELEKPQQGKEEITLTNTNQVVPWKITLVINIAEKKTHFNYRYKLEGLNVYQQLKCLEFFQLYEKGGSLQITNLINGISFPKSQIAPAIKKQSPDHYIELLKKLFIIQTKTLALFSIGNEEISVEEENEIIIVSEIVETGKFTQPVEYFESDFEAKSAKIILADFKKKNSGKLIHKSEIAQEPIILGNKIELGNFAFCCDVSLSKEEIEKLDKQLSKVSDDDLIRMRFEAQQEQLSVYYLNWLTKEKIEEIKSESFPEIVQDDKVGTLIYTDD